MFFAAVFADQVARSPVFAARIGELVGVKAALLRPAVAPVGAPQMRVSFGIHSAASLLSKRTPPRLSTFAPLCSHTVTTQPAPKPAGRESAAGAVQGADALCRKLGLAMIRSGDGDLAARIVAQTSNTSASQRDLRLAATDAEDLAALTCMSSPPDAVRP